MRKVSESGFETGLGPAMRGQTGLETAPDNRTVTRFTYAPEQKVRVLSQTLITLSPEQASLPKSILALAPLGTMAARVLNRESRLGRPRPRSGQTRSHRPRQ